MRYLERRLPSFSRLVGLQSLQSLRSKSRRKKVRRPTGPKLFGAPRGLPKGLGGDSGVLCGWGASEFDQAAHILSRTWVVFNAHYMDSQSKHEQKHQLVTSPPRRSRQGGWKGCRISLRSSVACRTGPLGPSQRWSRSHLLGWLDLVQIRRSCPRRATLH